MLRTNRQGYRAGRWMPWPLWRLVFAVYYRGVQSHPEKLARMSEDEPEADHIIFETSWLREILVETFAEAFRQGIGGVAREGWLLSRPWGFRLEEIEVPHLPMAGRGRRRGHAGYGSLHGRQDSKLHRSIRPGRGLSAFRQLLARDPWAADRRSLVFYRRACRVSKQVR